MHLIPNHAREQEMLDSMGVGSIDDLFRSVPQGLRAGALDLPDGEPERHLVHRLRKVLGQNQTYIHLPNFLGGGLKPQHVPAAVRAVAHRQELINAYTPYQPEVSQGILQILFEYQSMMADLTRMEVVNASMYDGMTALGEAGLMAVRCRPGRGRFLVPANLSWQKRSILENYTRGVGLDVESYAYEDDTGTADLGDLEDRLGNDVCGVLLENPNHCGVFEHRARDAGRLVQDAGALFVMGVDPTTLGVCTPPGTLSADIVVGEASCFGGAPALGGPLLGLFATTEALVRKMPGRLIGATHDEDGRRGYVMTLQAREQHIRRAKATSNICSNETLLASQAAIHLTLLGRTGVRDMGLHNLKVGAKLETVLGEAGLEKRFSGAHYNELVTRVGDVDALHESMLAAGVHAGLRLARDMPELADCMLWGTTPLHTPDDFTALQTALASAKVVA